MGHPVGSSYTTCPQVCGHLTFQHPIPKPSALIWSVHPLLPSRKAFHENVDSGCGDLTIQTQEAPPGAHPKGLARSYSSRRCFFHSKSWQVTCSRSWLCAQTHSGSGLVVPVKGNCNSMIYSYKDVQTQLCSSGTLTGVIVRCP